MIKSKHILLVFCALILLGCKKDEPNSSVVIDDSDCEEIQNVKKFFYFKVGSWWVYEEENSGEYDTITVTSSVEDVTSYNFITEVYSSHQNFQFKYYPLPGNSSGSYCPNNNIICNRCLRVLKIKFDSIQTIAISNCFPFIPKVGDTINNYTTGDPINRLYPTSKQDSFLLGTLPFGRTICIAEEHTKSELSQPTFHYYSDGVGLIKKQLLWSNQTWNLIDYHIEE